MTIPPPVIGIAAWMLLGCLPCWMVVLLHVCGTSGFSKISISEYPVSRLLSHVAHAFSMCAVNVYAMLTGYFCIKSQKLKLERYIRLWLLVAFYTLGIYTSFVLCAEWLPVTFELKQVALRSLYPIPFASGYWYFNAYTLLRKFISWVMPYIAATK